MQTCKTCKYARLVYNKKYRNKYIGCARITVTQSDKNVLDEFGLKPRFDAFSGTIYVNLRPDSNPDNYDTADVYIISFNHLICLSDSRCDLYDNGSYSHIY